MRVAIVTERTVHHTETNATTRTARLASALAGRDHEVTVFCSQWWDDGEVTTTDEETGVAYRAVTHHPSAPDLRFAARLPGVISGFDPDVIHAAHEPHPIVLGAGTAARLTRAPLVVDWYEDDPRSGRTERTRRLAARTPDRVIAPSRLVETEIRELGGSAEVIDRIPDAVDMDAIRETDPEPVADIVYARRLDADAGLESLFLALAELRGFDWSLAVVGDGPERHACERQAAEFRIDDRVSFLGARPPGDRIAIMKGARVAVHTAHRTPFPREFLRALACGCVGVAVYRVASSAHELIETHPRGIRVSSDDRLADAIQQAADMDHRTVEPSFAPFDGDAVVDRLLACYREARGGSATNP
jgi:glycosyltransferase involved in cell wall biosynthesis